MKKFITILFTASLIIVQTYSSDSHYIKPDYFNPKIINWIKTNISSETGLPLSFQIPQNLKSQIFSEMGESNSVGDVIERLIVEEGLIIYDGAVGQIVLTALGGKDNLQRAKVPIEVYWEGKTNQLASIRAGYPLNEFIYDPSDPHAVSSDVTDKGRRGFIFRIINAHGKYLSSDPLDGKTDMAEFPQWPNVHWEDWKPVAGENAWVVMAAMHLYHKKYFDRQTKTYNHNEESIELRLSEEIARAALLLQAKNGGIRMAPLGTYRNPNEPGFDGPQGTWWYNQISSENNLSWYAAFRMLYQVTGEEKYHAAMKGVENFFKTVWNDTESYFYQGANYKNGAWHLNDEHFALDVQTWAVDTFGPEKIDEWFGRGSAFKMWETSKRNSGYYDEAGILRGVGFTTEYDRLSVEWTAGAILMTQLLAQHYTNKTPEMAHEAFADSQSMRKGIELLQTKLSDTTAAYSYSSKRDWIPFGWNSHSPEVLSLASTGWVALIDNQINPFYLPEIN